MARKQLPDLATLSQRFTYDPETGIFRIKERTPDMYQDTEAWTAVQLCKSFNLRMAGRIAGARLNSGYIKIGVDRQQCLAHRLAFVFMGEEPPFVVDHINGDRGDNRWANLRRCETQRDNTTNRRRNSNNTSGFRGITRRRWRGACWEATIRSHDQKLYLGAFRCLGQAIAARKAAEREHGFFYGPRNG